MALYQVRTVFLSPFVHRRRELHPCWLSIAMLFSLPYGWIQSFPSVPLFASAEPISHKAHCWKRWPMLERLIYTKVYSSLIKLTFEFLIVHTTGQIVDGWRSNTMNIAAEVPSKLLAWYNHNCESDYHESLLAGLVVSQVSRWLDSPVRLQLGGAEKVRLNYGLARDVPPSTNILGALFMVNAFKEGRFYTTS